MKFFNGFKNKQYQLLTHKNELEKHNSLKSRKIMDLFRTKISYNPMLFRKTGKYPIKTSKKYEKKINTR